MYWFIYSKLIRNIPNLIRCVWNHAKMLMVKTVDWLTLIVVNKENVKNKENFSLELSMFVMKEFLSKIVQKKNDLYFGFINNISIIFYLF